MATYLFCYEFGGDLDGACENLAAYFWAASFDVLWRFTEVSKVELAAKLRFEDMLAISARVALFEAASEPARRGERGKVGVPVIEVVSSEDQAEGHERTDDGAASFAAEGDAWEGGEGLEDWIAVEVEFLLK